MLHQLIRLPFYVVEEGGKKLVTCCICALKCCNPLAFIYGASLVAASGLASPPGLSTWPPAKLLGELAVCLWLRSDARNIAKIIGFSAPA